MFKLPRNISDLIGDEKFFIDNIGMSDSTVVLFADKVLKIQTITEESEREHRVMKWLQGKLPVPKVLEFERDEKKNYLLMTKMPGEMACADKYMKKPEQLTDSLAKGLQMLWKVDINHCPFSNHLEKKLQLAKYNVDNNLVDLNHVEPDTFGKNGFKNPDHLLEWLNDNKPEEELVLSHGDFCLPNIFLTDEKVSGYIDLGRTGIADKWQDIALCYRSLLHNFAGKFTRKQYDGFDKNRLFNQLGLEPNWNKICYYMLLDELF